VFLHAKSIDDIMNTEIETKDPDATGV